MENQLQIAGTTIDPMFPVKMRIKNIFWETDSVFTLEAEPEIITGNKFHFLPGQFNMLYGFGTGEAAISISSDSTKTNTFLHTIHKVGYVTNCLSRLRKGDVIGVRGPFGSPWPMKEAEEKDVCIMAGGIGLAPLRPAIYHIFRNRKKYSRVTILYGARTPKDLLFRLELEQWARKHDVNLQISVDRADTSWRGHVGVVTTLVTPASLDHANTVAMVCGPELMMKYSIDELIDNGLPESSVYLSMERNMKCAVGFCGHCQFGPNFICKDGPVFNFSKVKKIFDISEL